MKNMKKLLQKAMVFTLTAAMLVGTPLTASAAGLSDLYQIEDGWGNVTGNEDNTRTGTVTATQTNSGILEANAQLEGIVLDETNIEVEVPEIATLTASLDWGTENNTVPDAYKDLNDDLLKRLQWKSSNTAIAAIRVPNRSYNGGPRDIIEVVPKAAGTATVTVSLDSKEYDIHYTAEATVTVVQYADELKFNDATIKEDALSGNIVDLNDWVDRYVDGKIAKTSDVLTFAVKGDSKVATLKNNVLTLKKDGTVKVLAIGKKVTSGWKEITIEKGNNAKKLAFEPNKETIKVNEGSTKDVKVLVKQKEDSAKACTNKISWSSKKPAIVDVKSTALQKLAEGDTSTMTLIAKAPGKAQVVAKASNGKSATLNVTVSADLTSIKIENAPEKLYSGQTIDLYELADQYFGKNAADQTEETGNKNFTDAGLKWSFDGDKTAQAPMKKVASINAKGVLTIKPDVSFEGAAKQIKVVAANAKKVNSTKAGDIKSNVLTINLEQVNVKKIIVTKGSTIVAQAVVNENGKVDTKIPDKKNNTDNIAVDSSRAYKLTAINETGDELDPAVLGWTASGNGKIVKASRNVASNGVIKALKKGKATVTINSATKKGNGKFAAIKTTFKANVTVPTKTLTLSVKNKGIAATGKRQTIAITPVIQKGSTTNKKNDIVWTATKKSGETTTPINDKVKNGKLTLDPGAYAAGDKITVTARVKNGGPITSITLTVVDASKKVVFYDGATKNPKLNNLSATKTIKTQVEMAAGGEKNPGDGNVSGVSYTVNKAGIVRIVDKGNGNIEIEPLTNGSVKITAATLDGKKGTLNVKVTGQQ